MPLLIVGLVFISVIFILEGAIIGKFLPTTAIFPAYLLMFDISISHTIPIVIFASISATIGQVLAFKTVTKSSNYKNKFQKKIQKSKIYTTVTHYFKKISPNTLLVTNIIPGIRGLCILPIAKNKSYTKKEIIIASFAGNLSYFAILANIVILSKILF